MDAGLEAHLDALRAEPGPSARELRAEALRAESEQRSRARPAGPEVERVEDLVAEGSGSVRVRLYRPHLRPGPLLVYLHGGGWVLGDLESHDRLCRLLTLAVLRWVDGPGRSVTGATAVGVGGDSAGGNLAALCCLRLRDAGSPQPALQVLVYPNTDLTFSQPSVTEKGSGWGREADAARWFAEQWVPDADGRGNPRVSPLLEPDLTGLAPALVVTAEHDPLRDEGNAYAQRLADAGVPVVHRTEPGLVHGFLGLDLVSSNAARAAERWFVDVGRLLHAVRGSG